MPIAQGRYRPLPRRQAWRKAADSGAVSAMQPDVRNNARGNYSLPYAKKGRIMIYAVTVAIVLLAMVAAIVGIA